MKRKLYFAAIAAAALTACNEQLSVLSDENAGKVELGVTLPAGMTKVTDVSNEDAVNDLQVFVFNESGNLEAYGRDQNSSLTLKCLPGSKNVVALVNAPLMSSIASYQELKGKKSALTDNKVGSLVMEGEKAIDLDVSSNVTIPVKRIVAKVKLSKIVNALQLDYHKKMTFAITSVYLINVAGEKVYLGEPVPEVWYNEMEYMSSAPEFLWQNLGGTVIASGQTYSTPHYFYCYPNHTANDVNGGTSWTPRYTRLVVEATLDGKTCYYPVSLEKVDQNTTYDISLTVNRPGSDSPDKPVDSQDAKFSIEVVEWADGGSIDETI